MKLVINGPARHGKDTVADMLAERMGIVKLDASKYIAENIILPIYWPRYQKLGATQEEALKQAYLDRVNHRPGWFHGVRMHLDFNPDFWKRFMEKSDIFCGHRDCAEHEDMRKYTDLSIWIIDHRKPLEPASSNNICSSGGYPHTKHDYVLYNDGDLHDLSHRVNALIRWIGEREEDKTCSPTSNS